MPFTFKLSKRLALMKASLVPAAAAVLAACQLQDRRGTTGPTLPSNSVVQVVIVPDTVTLEPSQALQFLAYGRTEAGDSTAITMTWSATDGAISSGGLYTASPFQGDYQVTATLLQTSASAAAGTSAPQGVPGHSVVHVRSNPGLAQVVVVPRSASVGTGATQQFSGYGLRTNGDSVAVSVLWSATGGAISSSGLYTAGSAPGGYVVRASAVGITGQAILAVNNASVASVVVSPASANMSVGGTTQLSATPKDAAGNVLAGRLVTWTSSSSAIATVSAGGLVSGAAVGSATITATSEGQSASATITVANLPVASVLVSPTAPNAYVGGSVQLTATPKDANGNPLSGRAVSWTTSNSAVATVSAGGLVTGLVVGSATITATSEGQSGTAAVTVSTVPVASVVVSPASANMSVGGTTQLSATPKDAAGNVLAGRLVTWTSSSSAIATVSAGGLVSGAAVGSATITATSEGQSASATITVATVPVAAVAMSPATAAVLVGATVQFTATLLDAAGNVLSGRSVTWASTGPAVATVSSTGLVTGVAPGAVTITATSEGQTGSAAVIVNPVPVASVSVSPVSAGIEVGQPVQFTATPLDANGTPLSGRSITWASSAPAVAAVSTGGLVTGVAAGTATITATSEGQGGSAAITVTVPASTSPGTVTDLAVAGVTETSVTLSFTELDDGTGAPANYDVRTAVGSTLTWWLANGALNKNGTCASPMAGTAIGTKRACTVVGLVAGTTYSFELVAFRGTLGVNAVFGGLSNIATATTSPSTAPVAAVAVSPTAASVAVGQTVQLAATLKDAGGNVLTGRTVAWASGSTGVATVSGSGLVTGVAAGTATITATSEGQSGTATVTVGSPSAANECATPTPGWIWCDDFEQDRLSRYTFWDHPESFQRVAGVGVGGSYGMRARFAAGQVQAGSLWMAMGRTPMSGWNKADAGTANYREMYWRMYLRTQPGWLGGSFYKLMRATVFATANWAQAAIAHVWGDPAATNTLQLDPARGTDAAGNVLTTSYNDGAHFTWLGTAYGRTPLFDASHVGQWYCIEAHVKLNDAGQSNGVFEYWINGALETQKTGLNWLGAFSAYGINTVMFENYNNYGSPVAQERYFDRIVISTQRIGC